MAAPREPACVQRDVLRVEGACVTSADDWLAQEVPVAFVVDGAPYAVVMATPADLEDLALGFCVTEGIAPRPAIVDVAIANRLDGFEVAIATTREVAPASRALPSRSSCGLCGTRTLEDLSRAPPPVASSALRVSAAAIARALDGLRARQSANALAGSLHAAAWADAHGEVALVREDVGRHNALDKLVGAQLGAARGAFDDGFLVLTSRASYEMVAKAAAVGIAFVVAISAPTALAVAVARSAGLTLVGFARPGRAVIYAGAERYRAGG